MKKSYGIRNRNGKKLKVKQQARKRCSDIWSCSKDYKSTRCKINSEMNYFKNKLYDENYILPIKSKRKNWHKSY